MTNKIAISVGHYLGEKTGDVEHNNAHKVADLLHGRLVTNGFYADIFEGTLESKVKQINKYAPDLALEIHFNALDMPGKYGTGIETLYWKGSAAGKAFATCITNELFKTMPFKIRGQGGVVARDDLYFLGKVRSTAVIPEPLFYDNPIDNVFLAMERGHQFIADGLYNGIAAFISQMNH